MGRKGSNSVIDLFVGLFKIVFAIVGMAGLVLVALVKFAGIQFSNQTESPAVQRGKRKRKTIARIPPKPSRRDFNYSGSTWEESNENYLRASEEWGKKYGVLVYGSDWEGDDEEDDDS